MPISLYHEQIVSCDICEFDCILSYSEYFTDDDVSQDDKESLKERGFYVTTEPSVKVICAECQHIQKQSHKKKMWECVITDSRGNRESKTFETPDILKSVVDRISLEHFKDNKVRKVEFLSNGKVVYEYEQKEINGTLMRVKNIEKYIKK